MLSWWLVSALAAPPVGVNPSDPTPYAEAHDALLAGPEGCWEVVGRASWDWSYGRAGDARGDAAFVGRMVDGEWHDFVVRSLGEYRRDAPHAAVLLFPHGELPFTPIWGEVTLHGFDLDGDGYSDDFRDAAVRQIGDRALGADRSYWDESRHRVVLDRTMALGNGTMDVEVHFADGALVPTTTIYRLPNSYSVPGLRNSRVRDADAIVEATVVEGMVLPTAEMLSFNGSSGGMRMTGVQSLTYRSFRPCGGEVDLDTAPISSTAGESRGKALGRAPSGMDPAKGGGYGLGEEVGGGGGEATSQPVPTSGE